MINWERTESTEVFPALRTRGLVQRAERQANQEDLARLDSMGVGSKHQLVGGLEHGYFPEYMDTYGIWLPSGYD